MKENRILLNTISSFAVQVMLTFQGLIIPKIILCYFGSELNGLISSLNQFLNFFTIVEGGVAGVILAALYKPMIQKDTVILSKILKTASKFLRELGIIFLGYSVIIAFFYPMITRNFDYWFVCSLVIILSISIFIQYYFTLLPQLFLRADNKYYLCNFVQIIFIGFNIILAIAAIQICAKIHFIKAISAAIYIIQPLILLKYIKAHYSFDEKCSEEREFLKHRWDGFGASLSNIVTTSADVVILTFLSTYSNISIYTVYYYIVYAIKGVIQSISNGFQATLGLEYASNNIEGCNKTFSICEFATNIVSNILYGTCIQLIIPFVLIYTKEIHDADYRQPLFSSLLIISQLIISIREPYIQMTFNAGMFRKVAKYSYIEAAINIVISTILCIRYNLVGVAIGTIISVIYRDIVTAFFLHKNVLERNICDFIKQRMVQFICMCCLFEISFLLNTSGISNWVNWIVNAIICIVVNTVCTLSVYFIFYRRETLNILGYIIKNF